MKYLIVAGEASGDLHASRLMHALKERDSQAEFKFIGGDLMIKEGGTCIRHYRQTAYMGIVPVLIHLPQLVKTFLECRKVLLKWMPEALILVDYPTFNLLLAKQATAFFGTSVWYYIPPKIWAWKEWRGEKIKEYVWETIAIFPFEVPYYKEKFKYDVHYLGNPTADEVREFKKSYKETDEEFRKRYDLPDKKIIALLAGSRKQEIKDNLPAMIKATKHLADKYNIVLAGAPSISEKRYKRFLKKSNVKLIDNDTYALLAHSSAALVTSGTATLETALFNVPQVVCYETPFPKLIAWLRRHILKVKYISLPNLIADKEVIKELVADTFTVKNIRTELEKILEDTPERKEMLSQYAEIAQILGDKSAPNETAQFMIDYMNEGIEEFL